MACGNSSCWVSNNQHVGWMVAGAVAPAVTRLVRVWITRVHHRRALGRLSDHQLADIGLSRSTAAKEMEKPFWQA